MPKKKSFLERLTGSIRFEENEEEENFSSESNKKNTIFAKDGQEPKESKWDKK